LFEKTPPETLTDIQRAARFFFLQKNCYGGLVVRRNFTVSIEDGSNYNPASLPKLLERTRDRLLNVQLECLPYEKIIAKCDRSATFFYLDPPYFRRPYYAFNLEEQDYFSMAGILKKIKGRFLLSLNDAPEIRKMFATFRIQELHLVYSSQRTAGKRYRELLIGNFKFGGG